jgi:CO/xanthine dehydrogenase FAD-binding subunit
MQEFEYLKPQTLDELQSMLQESNSRVLAGGTDIIVKMRHDAFPALTLVDISYLDELKFIREENDEINIGALTTHQEIVQSSLLQKEIPALCQASLTVGCEQTRNRGTLGGNIANASPAADTIPPLLVFDARVKLIGNGKDRIIPLVELLKAPGQTALETGEVIHSVSFMKLSGTWGSAFLKLGKRNGMAISVANTAACIVLDEAGKIADARLALGSVAPTVVRSSAAESLLVGKSPTLEVLHQAASEVTKDISPISDVRSTQEYRSHSAVVLVERVLQSAVQAAQQRRS